MAKDCDREPERSRLSCPICGQATARQWRPFCSRRCADVDLGRWLTGAYAVPTEEDLGDTPEADE